VSGSRPNGDPTSPDAFPMIPKELYDAILEEVKLNMRQQHSYYIEKYGKAGRQGSVRCPQTPNH